MDNSQHTQDSSEHERGRFGVRRFSTAVAGAAVLVALSVGAALAASSDDGATAEPTVEISAPAEGGSGGTDGGSVGVSEGGTSGDVSGGTSGDTSGGADPSPTSTSPDEPTAEPTDEPTAEPSEGPSTPSDLAELERRIAELDRKVDELPTKKELADALRAFADQLDGSGGSGEEPAPDPS